MDMDPEAIKALMLKTQAHLLVSIWFELLIYGISVPFFMAMAYILLTKKTESKFSSLVFGVTNTIIFIISTVHVGFNCYRLVNGYGYMRGPDGTALSYIQDSLRFDSWGHMVMMVILPWFANGLFLYRLFLVWNRNFLVIIVPGILYLFSVGINAMLLRWFRYQFVTYAEILPWVDSTYPILFCLNFLVTALISYKMWQNHKEEVASGAKTSHGFTLFNRIFWDSAALYTIISMIVVILYFKAQLGQFILQAGMSPALGIIAPIMAIRVHLAGTSTTILSDATDAVPVWLKDEKNSTHSTEKATADAA